MSDSSDTRRLHNRPVHLIKVTSRGRMVEKKGVEKVIQYLRAIKQSHGPSVTVTVKLDTRGGFTTYWPDEIILHGLVEDVLAQMEEPWMGME